MADICVIADDLTGAADTGVQFSGPGGAYVLFPWTDLSAAFARFPARAYAVDAAVRTADGRTAYRAARMTIEACLTLDPSVVYVKLDSALRGQVGALLAALKACCTALPIPVVCAFPETGRTTVGGRQFVDGTPVDAHEMGRDALTPVGTAHIPTMLAEYGRTGWISLDTVRSGGLSEALQRAAFDGGDFVVVDAQTRDDLDQIASALTAEGVAACAGSGGLAGSIAKVRGFRRFRGRGTGAPVRPLARGEHRRGRNRPAERPHPHGHIEPQGDHRPSTQSAAIRTPDDGPPRNRFPVSERFAGPGRRTEKPGSPGHAVASGRIGCHPPTVSRQSGHPDAAPQLLDGIGRIVRKVFDASPPALSIAVGGDTASSVLRRLDAEGLRLLGEVCPGVALSEIAGGPYDGIAFVTKSGGFGSDTTLVEVCDKVSAIERQGDER